MRIPFLLVSFALAGPAFAGSAPTHDAAMATWKAGDVAGAAKAYKSMTQADTGDARAWFMLGTVELQRGKLPRAIAALDTALDKGWYPVVGAYNLACAHARAGHPDAAFAALDQALAAGYSDPAHLAEDADLASLRGLDGWQARVDRADLNRNPCHHDEAYRAFDFWMGSWDVFDGKGTQVGTNAISAEENGCVVEERWKGSLGPTGRSLSYFDPADRQWHQDWVSSGGSVIHYAGAVDATGAMVLTGMRATPTTPAAPSRCLWSPQGDGTVTQTFQAQGDDGAWTTSAVLTYRPQAPAVE